MYVSVDNLPVLLLLNESVEIWNHSDQFIHILGTESSPIPGQALRSFVDKIHSLLSLIVTIFLLSRRLIK